MGYELISDEVIPAVTGGVFLFSRVLIAGSPVVSPAFILATYMVANSVGSMTDPADGNDLPLYVSRMPDDPSIKVEAGVIYDALGLKDGRLMTGEVIQHFGIQIKIRSYTHLTGYNKAEEINTSLDAVSNETVTISSIDYLIQNIKRNGPVISLGSAPGTEDHRLFVTNYMLTLKRIT